MLSSFRVSKLSSCLLSDWFYRGLCFSSDSMLLFPVNFFGILFERLLAFVTVPGFFLFSILCVLVLESTVSLLLS